MKRIYDPIYGLIELNEIESIIVDTPIFQRLRHIRQLSLAEYVYPTVNHNRFSHSLGVFHITDKIGVILQKQNEDIMSSYYLNNLKMAALLHDIGHFPFSHALEFNEEDENWEDLPSFFKISHEEFGVYLIKNSYLKDIIDTSENYDINLICNLIEGNDIADNPILNKIINWELDADRLDYLLRDSYFSGVKFGIIDFDYLISNFQIFNQEKLVINEKASRSIENFLIARFSLYDRLYTHKTISYFNFILKKIANSFITDKDYPSFNNETELNEILQNREDHAKLYELTDWFLMNVFLNKYKEIKDKNSIENNSLNRNLKSIILREKNYDIFNYQCLTKQQMGIIELADYKIIKLIGELKKEFNSEIHLDIPKNKFTKYESIFYPSIGLDQEKVKEIKEQEMKSIWIQQENEQPQLFYEWHGTYFKDLYPFKNIKYLVYLNKENQDLINKFEIINKNVKEIVKNL